ncbi:Signal transducer [Aspergillus sclerotialis]|uniref:Signal transducer n=1 Tax=Aspergillus sclerotialis TaxID=2070753 RepID=A0A3A2Z903_9EURO|nr:Signal transducer [Aspergillus sclerotialis]
MAEDYTSSGAQSSVEDEEMVESLIEGRGRRTTAGRHMSALLNAEADDDLALLFEEVDDDNEFSAAADDEDEDMRLDSSSDDDEDQGPNAKDDDDAGEKELEKEARAERKKRRAKDDLRLKALRKKVKIDPTATSTAPAPRPKKKSERISWLPTPEEGPTRSSSRRQTMQNKELTHARLKDSEERRVRLIATMEEAAKRKAQFKPKEWTQAEWLAEAERVERLNSKSVNRWEEMEKKKADERRAKIEALQNRRLEGPVMSYWSGIATWINGRLTRVGKANITHNPKPEKEESARRKSKKVEKEDKSVEEQKPVETSNTPAVPSQAPLPVPAPGSAAKPTPDQGEVEKQDQTNTENNHISTETVAVNDKVPDGGNSTNIPDKPTTPVVPGENPSATKSPTSVDKVAPGTGELRGSGQALPENDTEKEKVETQTAEESSRRNSSIAVVIRTPKASPTAEEAEPQPDIQASPKASEEKSGKDQAPPTSDEKQDATIKETPAEPSAPSEPSAPPEPSGPAKPPTPESAAIPQVPQTPSTGAIPMPTTEQADATTPAQQDQQAPHSHPERPPHIHEDPPHPTPATIERTERTLTILENFDDETAQSREFSIYFNAKKPPRLTST